MKAVPVEDLIAIRAKCEEKAIERPRQVLNWANVVFLINKFIIDRAIDVHEMELVNIEEII